MYKDIYERLKLIILNPTKAWQEIDEKGYEFDVKVTYVFPLISAGVIAVLLGQMWVESFSFQSVIRVASVTSISYLVGFFAAVYLLKKYLEKKYDREYALDKISIFIAYSSSLMLLMNIVVGLIPTDMFFLKIFNVYTAYIVAQGSYILDIKEKEQNSFVVITTIIILSCPFIIESLITFMMPGMKL